MCNSHVLSLSIKSNLIARITEINRIRTLNSIRKRHLNMKEVNEIREKKRLTCQTT